MKEEREKRKERMEAKKQKERKTSKENKNFKLKLNKSGKTGIFTLHVCELGWGRKERVGGGEGGS